MSKTLYLALILSSLLACQPLYLQQATAMGLSQESINATRKGIDIASSTQCWTKGGVGQVGDVAYTNAVSQRNELVVIQRQEWVGAGRNTEQLVLIYDRSVTEAPMSVPGFNINKSIVILFKPERIIYYDFSSQNGGYIKRRKAR